jgi:hypothetical protein
MPYATGRLGLFSTTTQLAGIVAFDAKCRPMSEGFAAGPDRLGSPWASFRCAEDGLRRATGNPPFDDCLPPVLGGRTGQESKPAGRLIVAL